MSIQSLSPSLDWSQFIESGDQSDYLGQLRENLLSNLSETIRTSGGSSQKEVSQGVVQDDPSSFFGSTAGKQVNTLV